MKNKQAMKLFIVLVLCTTYIFSFSHFGVRAYDAFMNSSSTFDDGTKVGPIDLSSKTKEEANEILNEQVQKWFNEASIEIQYKEKTADFDSKLITFRVGESVNKIKEGKENNLIALLESPETILTSLSPSLKTSDFNLEKLQKDILSKAVSLNRGKFVIELANFLNVPSSDRNNVISQTTIKSKISKNDVKLITKDLKEIELAPKSQFSLLTLINDLGMNQISNSAINKMATGIYEVILPTNFTIFERHISDTLPSYAKLGIEAKVNAEKNMDLIFSNPNNISYKIYFKWKNNSLVVSLKGPSFIQKYKVKNKDKETYKPKVVVQFNPQLTAYQKVVEREGKEGLSIKVVREIFAENGELVKTEAISEDFYAPIHQVEVRGLILEGTDANENSSETIDDPSTPDTEDDNETVPPTDENYNEYDNLENPDEQPKG